MMIVFRESSPPSPTNVVKANKTNANSSAGPKLSAISAKGAANSVNKMTEIVPPTKDATAAAIRARPACPFCAMGRPSKVVATAVEAPGIPSKIEDTAPPYIAP